MGSRVRFYTDEQMPKAVIASLRRRGIDVLTAHEAGLLAASDETHLAFAWKHLRVLVTLDADFLRLNKAGLQHAGIAYAPQGTAIGTIVRGLTYVYNAFTPEEMRGRVEYLTRHRG